MLKFDKDNYLDLIEHFQSQKQIKSWSGVQTIKKHNLLHRAAKVPVIIDCLVNAVNKLTDTSITQYIHLESMRNGMYEDLAKTILNDLSKKTKNDYPEYAKHYNKVMKQISADLNLSKDPKVEYLANIGDILNSYFEAKLENTLGNNTDKILEALNDTNSRLETANLSQNVNEDFEKNVLDIAQKLTNNDPSISNYSLIIENTQNQMTIERWAKRLSLNDFTLLEHSARVTALVDIFLQINKSENNFDKSMELNVFRYSLYHDYPEVILNDMPSPVKQDYPILDKIQKNTEKEIMNVLELTNSKTAKFICKIADIYDCLYESKAEIQAGNRDPEYIKNRDNYENTYKKQLNKFKDSVSVELIKLLEEMYFDPVIPEIKKDIVEEVKKSKNEFLMTLSDSIISLANKPDLDGVNYINSLLNDLTNNQLVDLKNCLKKEILMNDIQIEDIENSGIHFDKILYAQKEDKILSNEVKDVTNSVKIIKNNSQIDIG